jgi:hypothetical protein
MLTLLRKFNRQVRFLNQHSSYIQPSSSIGEFRSPNISLVSIIFLNSRLLIQMLHSQTFLTMLQRDSFFVMLNTKVQLTSQQSLVMLAVPSMPQQLRLPLLNLIRQILDSSQLHRSSLHSPKTLMILSKACSQLLQDLQVFLLKLIQHY